MARRPPGKLGTQVIDIAHDVSGPVFASALDYATEKLLQLWRASNFGEGPLTPPIATPSYNLSQLATVVSIFEKLLISDLGKTAEKESGSAVLFPYSSPVLFPAPSLLRISSVRQKNLKMRMESSF
jgi:hypothetical protein